MSVFVLADIDRAFLLGDSHTYDKQAMLLLDHHAYSTLGRPPLYSAFLAVTYGVFGHHPEVAVILQCLLDAVTAVLIIGLALSLGLAGKHAVWSGWFYAVFPLPILMSVHLLSETLFNFLTILTLWLWVRTVSSCRWKAALGTGACLGLSAVCRTIAMYVPILLIGGILFLRESTWKRRIVATLLLLLGFTLCAGPVIGYNGVRYGMWSTSSIGDLALFGFNAPGAVELSRGKSPIGFVFGDDPWQPSAGEMWDDLKARYGWKEEFYYEVMDNAGKTHIMRTEALGILREIWPWTVVSQFLGVARCFVPTGMMANLNQITAGGAFFFPLAIVSLIVYAAVLGLSLLGFVPRKAGSSGPTPRSTRLAAAGLFLVGFYLLFVTGASGHSRYLNSTLPLLCVLAARALSPGGILSRMHAKPDAAPQPAPAPGARSETP